MLTSVLSICNLGLHAVQWDFRMTIIRELMYHLLIQSCMILLTTGKISMHTR